MAHDINGLEVRIKALQEGTSKLRDAKHAESLLLIIHRPGFTSVQEFELVQAHVAGLHDHVDSLHRGFEALVAAADKIGKP